MSAAGRPAGGADTGTAWYVYGVVPADAPTDLSGSVRGVGGGTVELVTEGSLAALAGEVPLAEFDDEHLAANLHDPEWLEAGVRSHDAVLSAAAAGAAAVVPFRFGTIYRSEEHVRAMLSEHPDLHDALAAVQGKVELGVKGFIRATGTADDPESADVSPGRRYLEQKQRARRATEDREARAARVADDTHARLAAIAADARANALQASTEPEAAMFLNGAYLVPAANETEFRAAVTSLAARLEPDGVTLEVTGPWPPYNFVEVET